MKSIASTARVKSPLSADRGIDNNIPSIEERVSESSTRHGVLRLQQDAARVKPIELFFDLVFVFAIAQLSHALLNHLTFGGVMQTLILFVAVWWVWIYTTWCTNWLVTDRVSVRLMLFALMLLGLVLSTSIPEAFGDRGVRFALAYVAMQLGRSMFMLGALAGQDAANFRNYQRISVWLLLSAPLWIGGGLADPDSRPLWWAGALFIDFVSPMAGFTVPGLGRSTTTDWKVSGEHMAERCGLFVIIALGEVIMLAGVTFSDMAWTPPVATVFIASVISAIAMWWIYFNIGAERATHLFAQARDPGAIARAAYTYIHLPILSGIVATAAGIELLLAHPSGHVPVATAAVVTGAPAVFLFGELLFKRATAGWYLLSHLVGLLLCGALGYAALQVSPVTLSVLNAGLLTLIAVWETVSLRRSAMAVHQT